MELQAALSTFETLKKEFAQPATPATNEKCGQLLQKLKVQLTKVGFLASSQKAGDNKELLLAREALEIGAYWAIRTKDIVGFERYISQLQTYYFDYHTKLPVSQRMYPLLGLNLLHLLAQGRISDFHMQLELIDPQLIQENIYIKHSVKIEQSLMEGSYNKVWKARQDVPAQEYLFFMDMLMQTIRNEIASCSEKSYESLPIQDAISLFYVKDMNELSHFANTRGWNISVADKKICFNCATETGKETLKAHELLKHFLDYGRELERIV